jgi:hypothetical protein
MLLTTLAPLAFPSWRGMDHVTAQIECNLSRRRLLGLGVAVIPAAMVLGSGVANARPNLSTRYTIAAAAATPIRHADGAPPGTSGGRH